MEPSQWSVQPAARAGELEPGSTAEEGVPPDVAVAESVQSFLGDWFQPMRTILDEIGVEAVEDFKELDKDDVARLSSTLKKIQAKKFAANLIRPKTK